MGVPEWALARARALRDEQMYPGNFCPMDNAFALYIAAHEEAPIDPLLVAAREVVAATQHNWPDSPWHMHEAAELRAGGRDYTLVVKAAYEGVRRGVELAQGEN